MENNEFSAAKTVFAMRSMYFIVWGAQFIGQQYTSVYLRELSFTNDFTVGMIMSFGYMLTTIFQLTWGNVADHSKSKNKILNITIIGLAAGLLTLILPKHTSSLTLLPCIFLFYSFLVIPGLMTDTIVVENIDKTNVPFGTVKCFASAGAGTIALVMFFLSLFMKINPSTTFIVAFFTATLSLIPARFLPPTKGHAHGLKGNKEKSSIALIFKNRRLMLLLFFILFLFIGIQAANVFMGIYYSTDAGMNAGLGMYGLFFAICIATETFLMSYGNKFWQAMDIYHIFTLVSVAACIRSFVLFLAPNIYIIQLSAICHAFLFAPLWSRLSPYANSIVTKELRATGQAAWYIMAFGISPMIGSALGGAIASSLGVRNLFLVTGVMLSIITVVFYFLFKRQRVMDKMADEEELEQVSP